MRNMSKILITLFVISFLASCEVVIPNVPVTPDTPTVSPDPVPSTPASSPDPEPSTPPVVPDGPVITPPSPPGPVATKKLGTFGVQRVSMPSSRSTVNIDVGDISAADTAYFFLKNVGDQPITDITITSNDIQFVVTPGTLTELASDATSTVTTLIRISINHGSVIGGMGLADVIAAGSHTATITINGKTKDAEGNVVDAETLTVNVDAFIKLADFEVEGSNDGTTWNRIVPDVNGALLYWNSTAGYAPKVAYANYRVRNTGNVTLKIGEAANDSTASFTGSDVAPNASVSVTTSNIRVKTNNIVFPIMKYGTYAVDIIPNTDIARVYLIK